MRRSISARLFLGFLVVLVSFGGVMGYTFFRLHRLQQELLLINTSYLPLVRTLAKFDTLQNNLMTIIAVRGTALPAGDYERLRAQVDAAPKIRRAYVRRALKITRATQMDDCAHRLRQMPEAFRRSEPLFEQLFGSQGPVDPEVTKRLSRLEDGHVPVIRGCQKTVKERLKAFKTQIEQEQHNAFVASLVTMLIALLVTLVVTIGSQLTLRPLRRLVEGTKQIGSGDYRHRVEVRSRDELGVLAREFNSMAAAIDEREQRLIRSERMSMAGEIASHITHEIRNPLSSISLNTELLEEELEGDEGIEESRKLCASIRREVDRLTDITEEYLAFGRLPRPHLKPEDINEILLDLLSFVSTELRGKGIELVQELAPRLPAVEADDNQLRRAFGNLLRNSGEAMATGGALRVTTRAVDGADGAQGMVEATIADTGVGISKENLAKLFEPFFSTKEAGTGLGLPLTQKIIQEHGGTIEVDSEPGKGTRFVVRLPVAGRFSLESRQGEG
jgi:signal transduction histidine kinase